MFYANFGTLKITADQEFIDNKLEDLVESFLPNADTDGNDIFFDEEGDIEDSLSEFLEKARELGIQVNGEIKYSGDYDGVYLVKDTVLETGDNAALDGISTELLIAELKKRGADTGKKAIVFIEDGCVVQGYASPGVEIEVVDFDENRDDEDKLQELYDTYIDDSELKAVDVAVVLPGYEEEEE